MKKNELFALAAASTLLLLPFGIQAEDEENAAPGESIIEESEVNEPQTQAGWSMQSYYDESGQKVVSSFLEIDGATYYFDDEGICSSDTLDAQEIVATGVYEGIGYNLKSDGTLYLSCTQNLTADFWNSEDGSTLKENAKKIIITAEKENIALENNVFSQNKVITEVQMEGISTLGDSCFQGCRSLESIQIPESVTSFGASCFQNCRALTSITLPSAISSLPEKCFANCNSLTSILIPDSVTSLGNSCFSGCSSLSSITLPSAISSLPEKCFASCSSLTSILIPDSVTSLGSSCFSGCSSLSSITLPSGISSLPDSCFQSCKSLTSIEIPKSVESIEKLCFYGCSSLESITMPEGVTSLGNLCFNSCKSLVSITIPDSVVTFGKYIFYECTGLEIVQLPSGIDTLPYGIFYGCSSLTSFTIPDSVTSLETYCFAYCSALKNVIIPESVTNIDDFTFWHCISLKSISIPDSVTRLGEYCFSYCESLESVQLSKNLSVLDEGTFYNNSALASIVIPEGVNEVASFCFENCTSLKTIVYPSSVARISNTQFKGADNLQQILVLGKDTVLELIVNEGEEAYTTTFENITIQTVSDSAALQFAQENGLNVLIIDEDWKADYTELDRLFLKIDALNPDFYTPESADTFTSRLAEIKASIDKNLPKSDQSVLDGYVSDLNKALGALELKPADYSKVNALIDSFNALDQSQYTQISVEAVNRYIKGIDMDLKVSEQEKVDAYASNLKKKIDQLTLKSNEQKKLEASIKTIAANVKKAVQTISTVLSRLKNLFK